MEIAIGRFLVGLELMPKNPTKSEFFPLPYQADTFNGEEMVGAFLPVLKNEEELIKQLDTDLKNINEKSKYSHTLTDLGVNEDGNLTPSISSDNPQDFYHRITKNYSIIFKNNGTVSPSIREQAVK